MSKSERNAPSLRPGFRQQYPGWSLIPGLFIDQTLVHATGEKETDEGHQQVNGK